MSAEEKEKLRLEAIRMTNPLITVSLQDIEDQKTAALELIKPIEQVFTIHKSYVKLYETLSKLINDTLKEFKDIAAIDPTSRNLKAISILYDNRAAIDAISDIDPATILAKYTTTVTDLETKYKVIDKIAKGCASEITAFDTRIKKNATDHAHGDEPMINAAIADQSAIPADITTYVTNVKTYLIGTDFDNLIDSFDVMIGEYKGNLDAMSYYMINLFDEVYTIGDNNLKDSIENATTECSDYFTELSKYGSHYTTFENKTNMSNLYAKFYDIANFDVTISGKKEKLSAIAQDLTTKFGSKGITYPYKNDTVGSDVTNYKTKVIDEIDKLKTKADTCLTAVVVDPKSSKDHKDAMKLFTDKAKCIHGYIQAVETIVTTLCYPAANAAVHLDMLRDVDKYNMEHKLILDTIIADTAIITKGVTEFETTRVELAKLETELDKVKPEVKIKFENECIKLTKRIQTNLVEGVLTEVKYKVGDGTNESQLNSSIDTTEKEYTESVNVAIAAAKNEDLKRGGTTEQDALNAELTSLDIPKYIRDLSKAVVELCEIVMLDSKTIAIKGVTIKPRESYLKYQTVISYCIKNTKVESPVKDITNAVTEVSDYIADVGKEITDLSNYITDNIAKLNPLVTDISKKLPNLVKSGSHGEKYFTGTSIEAKYSSSAQAKVVADLKTIYGDVTSRYVNVRSTECVLNYYNATNMSTLYSLANDGKNGIYSTYLNKIEATLTSKIKIPSADVQKTDIYKQYAQLISNLSQIFNLADLIKYIDSYLHFESLVDNYNAKKDASTGNYTGSDASVLLSKFTTAVNDWINSVPATTDVCLSNLPSVIGEVTNMNIILDDLLSSKDAELSLVDSKGASLVYIGSSDQIKTYSMDEYNKQFGIIQTRYVDVYTNNMAKFTSLKPVLINFYKKEDAGFGKAIVDYNKTVKDLADSVNPICNYLDTKSIKYNGGTFIKALNDLKDNALAVVDNKASGNITIAEALPGFQIVNKLINNVDHYTNSTIDYLAEYEVEFNTVISHVGKFKDADFTNNQFDDRLVELQNAHTNQSKLSKDANAWIKQLNDDIDQTASPKFKFKELEDAAKVAAIGYWQKQIQKENWGNLETAVTGIDVDAYGLGCITAVIGDIVANSSELAKYTNVLDLDGKFHGSAVDNKFPDYKKVTDDVSKFKLAYSGYIILSKSTYKDLLELDDSDLSKYTKSLTDYTRLLNDYNRGSADPKSPEGLVTELLTKVNFTDSDTTKNSIIGYLLEYDSKTLSKTIVSAIIDAEADADAAAKKAAATKRAAEEAAAKLAAFKKTTEEEAVKKFTERVNSTISSVKSPTISDEISSSNKDTLKSAIVKLSFNLTGLERLKEEEDSIKAKPFGDAYVANADLENKITEVNGTIKNLNTALSRVNDGLEILNDVQTEYNKVTGSAVSIPSDLTTYSVDENSPDYTTFKKILEYGLRCEEVSNDLSKHLSTYNSIESSGERYESIKSKLNEIKATISEVKQFYTEICAGRLGMDNKSTIRDMLTEVESVEKSALVLATKMSASVSTSTPPPPPAGGPSTSVLFPQFNTSANINELKKHIEDMFKDVKTEHPSKHSTLGRNPYSAVEFRQRYKYLKYIQLYVSYLQILEKPTYTNLSKEIDKLIKDMTDANKPGFTGALVGYTVHNIKDIEDYYSAGFVITKKPNGFEYTADNYGNDIMDDISISEYKNELVTSISDVNNRFMEIYINNENAEKQIYIPEKYLEYLLKQQENYNKIKDLKDKISTIGHMDSTDLGKNILLLDDLIKDYSTITKALEEDRDRITKYITKYAINISISVQFPESISDKINELNTTIKEINNLSTSTYKVKSKSYSKTEFLNNTKANLNEKYKKCIGHLEKVKNAKEGLNTEMEKYINALSEIDKYLSNEHDKNDLTALVNNANSSVSNIINAVDTLESKLKNPPNGITVTFDPTKYTYNSNQYNITEAELNQLKLNISSLISNYGKLCKDIDDLLTTDSKDYDQTTLNGLRDTKTLTYKGTYYQIKYKINDINSKIADVEKALKTTELNRKTLLTGYLSYSDLNIPFDNIDALKSGLSYLGKFYNVASSIFNADTNLAEEYKSEQSVSVTDVSGNTTTIELSVDIAKKVTKSLKENLNKIEGFVTEYNSLIGTTVSNSDSKQNEGTKDGLLGLLDKTLKFDANITLNTPKIVELVKEPVFKEPIKARITEIEDANNKITHIAPVLPVTTVPPVAKVDLTDINILDTSYVPLSNIVSEKHNNAQDLIGVITKLLNYYNEVKAVSDKNSDIRDYLDNNKYELLVNYGNMSKMEHFDLSQNTIKQIVEYINNVLKNVKEYDKLTKEVTEYTASDTDFVKNNKIIETITKIEILELGKITTESPSPRLVTLIAGDSSKITNKLNELLTVAENAIKTDYYSYDSSFEFGSSILDIKEKLKYILSYYNKVYSILGSSSILKTKYFNGKTVKVTPKNTLLEIDITISPTIVDLVIKSLQQNIVTLDKFYEEYKELIIQAISSDNVTDNESLIKSLTVLLNKTLEFDKNITSTRPKIVELYDDSVYKNPINARITNIQNQNTSIMSKASGKTGGSRGGYPSYGFNPLLIITAVVIVLLVILFLYMLNKNRNTPLIQASSSEPQTIPRLTQMGYPGKY
jgi:PHD/YefM family antitoxin component YafN of YafNO toxin-antitoxin module/Asp-tRNA(Asn)/Glu-tRNA(Gln) amidotransferase C subunit